MMILEATRFLLQAGAMGEGGERGFKDLTRMAEKQDAKGLKEKLHELVPEYTPQDSESIL